MIKKFRIGDYSKHMVSFTLSQSGSTPIALLPSSITGKSSNVLFLIQNSIVSKCRKAVTYSKTQKLKNGLNSILAFF